jgi:hypothetical protein
MVVRPGKSSGHLSSRQGYRGLLQVSTIGNRTTRLGLSRRSLQVFAARPRSRRWATRWGWQAIFRKAEPAATRDCVEPAWLCCVL